MPEGLLGGMGVSESIRVFQEILEVSRKGRGLSTTLAGYTTHHILPALVS